MHRLPAFALCALARLTRVNAQLTRAIADADGRPQWLPGDFFGATSGRTPPVGVAAD